MPKPSSVSDSYAKTAGLLLAGGMGARLGGVRKADLMVAGRRLYDLACGNLCAQSHRVIAAMGAAHFAPATADATVTQIADPGNGPAAAMLHAVRALPEIAPDAEYLVVAPCDAPFMPDDFAARAAELVEQHDAVVGEYSSRLYPTHSLWRVSALTRLASEFAPSDCPAIFALLDRVRSAPLPHATDGGINPFFNINVRADLVAANREMERRRGASFS